MATFKENPEGVKDIEFSNNDKIIYRGSEAEDVLKDRKIVHSILKMVKGLDQVLSDKIEIENDGISVVSEPNLNTRKSKTRETFYYKVKINGKEFFLKRLRSQLGEEYGGGYQEFKDSAEAEEMLRSMSGVRVVNYKLGFESNKHWYFVSEWNSALETTLEDYLNELKKQASGTDASAGEANIKHNLLLEKARQIQKLLKEKFDDVFAYNMAYDPKADCIVVFDLNKKKEEKIRVE